MLASGSVGGFTAIDRVEILAGSSIMLAVYFVGLAVLKRGFTIVDVVGAGAVLDDAVVPREKQARRRSSADPRPQNMAFLARFYPAIRQSDNISYVKSMTYV